MYAYPPLRCDAENRGIEVLRRVRRIAPRTCLDQAYPGRLSVWGRGLPWPTLAVMLSYVAASASSRLKSADVFNDLLPDLDRHHPIGIRPPQIMGTGVLDRPLVRTPTVADHNAGRFTGAGDDPADPAGPTPGVRTHVLNRGGRGVQSPLDRLRRK